ncbi:MAG: T9SS type A sorting domain-containing protein [Bacteroidia bacterium]
MKTICKNSGIIKILLFTILFLSKGITAKASHILGGEITWNCLGSGAFQFQIKIFRDCGGIALDSINAIKVWGHPTLCKIDIDHTLTQRINLSPAGCLYDCYSTGTSASGFFAEEWIFTSFPVILDGVPPAGGWTFSWNDCCRAYPLYNLDSDGYTVRSVMYAYNGQNTNPCYDNAPYFAEVPCKAACSSTVQYFNPFGRDNEKDSLTYRWAVPLNGFYDTISPCPAPAGNAVFAPDTSIFNSPYSYTYPFPGMIAQLDSSTGQFIRYGGFDVSEACVSVSEFRCGQKIGEIFRDIGFMGFGGCQVIGSISGNHPPLVNPPFPNSTYNDTVCAGDTVRFTLQSYDFDINMDTTFQSITITAAGDEFGTNFTDTVSGCPYPPCAVLNKTLPSTDFTANNIQFYWVTSLNHLNNIVNCSNPSTYCFLFKFTDSYCYWNASNLKEVCITILPCITGQNEINELPGLSITPNPSSGIFTITWNSELNINCTLLIKNLPGQELKSFAVNGNHNKIDLSSFAKGVYIVELKSKTNLLFAKKIIIN